VSQTVKSSARRPFGNDEVSRCEAMHAELDVVTKSARPRAFGNDAHFVRVRRRKLNGCQHHHGRIITASSSFDVVRAVRINGKPRHKFLFGLGSLKEPTAVWALLWFWSDALRRMNDHGLDQRQRLRLIDALVRKGVPKPPLAECERFTQTYNWTMERFDDLRLGE
jgi:hypothetical protein